MVTVLDKSRQETQHRFPSFLPDGRHFIYLARTNQPDKNGVFVASLDSTEVRPLVSVDSAAVYANGHLLFVRENILMAQPFDAAGMRLSGEASPIASSIALVGAGAGARAFSVCANGVLAYRVGTSLAVNQLVWFDRAGRRLGTLGEPGDYSVGRFKSVCHGHCSRQGWTSGS